MATSYGNLGSVYYSQGDYHKAIKFHSQALDIQKQVLGEHHPDVATSYGNLGSVYHIVSSGEIQMYHNLGGV